MHLSEYTHIHTDWTKSLKKLTTQIGGCVAGVHGVDAGWLLWNNIRDRRLIHGKIGSSQNAAEAQWRHDGNQGWYQMQPDH